MAAAPDTPSPCRTVCLLEGRLCIGCGRTLDEIAAWPMAQEDERQAIAARAAGRLAQRSGQHE